MYCKEIISLYPVRIDPEEPSYCRKEMPMPQPTRYILWVRDSGAANAVPGKKPLPICSEGAFFRFFECSHRTPTALGKGAGEVRKRRRPQRILITSLCGGSPNSRLYSRLNCVGLS